MPLAITIRWLADSRKTASPIGFYPLDEHERCLGIGVLFVDRPFIRHRGRRLLRSHLIRQAVALGAPARCPGRSRAPRVLPADGHGGQVEIFHDGKRLIWMMANSAKW
jgi:hypothetical protein